MNTANLIRLLIFGVSFITLAATETPFWLVLEIQPADEVCLDEQFLGAMFRNLGNNTQYYTITHFYTDIYETYS